MSEPQPNSDTPRRGEAAPSAAIPPPAAPTPHTADPATIHHRIRERSVDLQVIVKIENDVKESQVRNEPESAPPEKPPAPGVPPENPQKRVDGFGYSFQQFFGLIVPVLIRKGGKKRIIQMTLGSVLVLSMGTFIAWIGDLWPAGPLKRPEVPIVIVMHWETRTRNDASLRSADRYESILSGELLEDGKSIADNSQVRAVTFDETKRNIVSQNWWRLNQPIHILVWAVARADYVGEAKRSGNHNWNISYTVDILDLKSNNRIATLRYGPDDEWSGEGETLQQCSTGDCFSPWVKEAAKALPDKINEFWERQRAAENASDKSTSPD